MWGESMIGGSSPLSMVLRVTAEKEKHHRSVLSSSTDHVGLFSFEAVHVAGIFMASVVYLLRVIVACLHS